MIKIIKYDFSFSGRIFVAMAAILLALAVVLRFTMSVFVETDNVFALSAFLGLTMSLLMVAVAIASITQIFQFFNRNFFGDSGYLMLTLPVHRAKLLISKVLVSLFWFNFMLATAAAAMFIMWESATRGIHGVTIFSRLGVAEAETIIGANVMAIFAICTLFFCLSLARSVFGGKRVHGVIAGVVGGAYFFALSWLSALLERRFMITETHQWDDWGSFTAQTAQIGLRYGRIPLSDNVYIDIFVFGLAVAMGAIALFGACYLLKRCVALR